MNWVQDTNGGWINLNACVRLAVCMTAGKTYQLRAWGSVREFYILHESDDRDSAEAFLREIVESERGR